MPLTRAVSTLEAFQKERERSMDNVLDQSDPKERAKLIALDGRTSLGSSASGRLCATVAGLRRQQTATDRDALDRVAARLSAVQRA